VTQEVPGVTSGPPSVELAEATRVWWRLGWLSFGGPSAQIALMHRELVDERGWLTEQEFLDALGFCMLLPGPEAMQLATYAGWRLHGTRGGLIAGLLFVLPGAAVVLALSILYATLGQLPLVLSAFRGIQAAVLVLVLQAVFRMSTRALAHRRQYAIAAAAFVGLFAFAVPFPLLVLAAGLIGARWPIATPASHAPAPPGSRWGTLRTVAIGLAVWVLPLLAIVWAFGPQHLLSQLAWFFSRLAMVTFGGAYAVLAYMSQEVVARHGWLTPRQMLDGLGLAETTPGPLILVTEFVGFLAAFRSVGAAALWQGLLGAAVALWATFAPCFLWVFAGAPYIDRIGTQPTLRGALAGITAAVLGVILQLAVWFAMHVLFASVGSWRAGPVHLPVPDARTLDLPALALTLVSAVLLLRLRWSVHRVLGALVVLSLALACLGR
jgi:chromate transporter